MFNVLNLSTGKLVCGADLTTPMVFDDGAAASLYCADMLAKTGIKCQPRRIVVDNEVWRARERARFASGQYTRLPWDAYPDSDSSEHRYQRRYCWFYQTNPEAFAHAYPHASKDHPGKIAYTPDDAAGQADRQTVVTPGRFLTTFYSHMLRSVQIRDLATQYSSQFGTHEMRMARTADEVVSVYTNGPTSCMSHGARDYNGHVHPTHVYGDGPDLAVAYLVIKAPSEDDDKPLERITARVVCWPAEKVYSTIYGDSTRLRTHLDKEGYRYGSLVGARIPRIKNERGSGYIMPYLDNDQYVEKDGDYWVIVDDREGMCANNTHGLISDGEWCPHCEETRDARGFEHVHDVDESWCQYCVHDDTFWCDHTDRRYSNDSAVRMGNGAIWSQEAFADYGFVCDYDGENYHADYGVEVIDEHGNEQRWYRRNFARHGIHCPHCDTDVTREHVCSEAPTEGDTHVATQGRDEHTAQIEMPLSIAATPVGPFPIGARVRLVNPAWRGACPIGTIGIVTDYRRGDMIGIRWETNCGQMNGGYYAHYFELAAPDLSTLCVGDYVTVTEHNCLSVDIPAGTYRVIYIDPDRCGDRRHIIRCDIYHDNPNYGLWIETSAIIPSTSRELFAA